MKTNSLNIPFISQESVLIYFSHEGLAPFWKSEPSHHYHITLSMISSFEKKKNTTLPMKINSTILPGDKNIDEKIPAVSEYRYGYNQ